MMKWNNARKFPGTESANINYYEYIFFYTSPLNVDTLQLLATGPFFSLNTPLTLDNFIHFMPTMTILLITAPGFTSQLVSIIVSLNMHMCFHNNVDKFWMRCRPRHRWWCAVINDMFTMCTIVTGIWKSHCELNTFLLIFMGIKLS